MTEKKRDWLIAFAYVFTIYATLEVAGIPLAYLRAHNMLRITLGIMFFISFAACIRFITRHHPRSPERLLGMCAIALLYYLAARTVKTPEEQVHFFEYGLVGILFFRAYRHTISTMWKLWIASFFTASFAGYCDELLQGLTPNRHYDIHDVFLNMISVGLGLLVFRLTQPSIKH